MDSQFDLKIKILIHWQPYLFHNNYCEMIILLYVNQHCSMVSILRKPGGAEVPH